MIKSMNNPIVLIKYKFYKFLLKQKNLRAINAEQRFIKGLSAVQKDYYEKVQKMLSNPETEVVYVNSHLILKLENTIITIDVYVNQSLLTYTSHTDKGTYHTEHTFGEDSKLFIMHYVEANLNKRRKAILEEKTKMLEEILGE